MQIIVLGVFFDCYWPPNAQIILISLLKSCSFDLFQTESIYTETFGFKDSESFSELFDEAGLEGSIFVIGIGPIFLFIILFPIYMAVHSCARWVFKGEEKIKCIIKFIQPKNFTVILMIFLLEGCLELGLTCSVSLLKVSKTNNIFQTNSDLCVLIS